MMIQMTSIRLDKSMMREISKENTCSTWTHSKKSRGDVKKDKIRKNPVREERKTAHNHWAQRILKTV
jgi:hypothetical protein